VAFIPRTWATRHAGDILSPLAKSTGEYDVALVSIEQPKEAVPPIAFDTREAVAFTGDTVLIAGYPASFLGGILIQKSLSAVSAFTTIPEVLTFSESLVDAVSLGKTVLAQQGSSGGGVFNQHGYLVGLIATATLGKTTDDRELRAITLAHINRTFRSEVGMSIEEYLSQGSSEELRTLFAPTARALVPLFLPALNLSTTSALL
jgi:S1-C subfamily serine protease